MSDPQDVEFALLRHGSIKQAMAAYSKPTLVFCAFQFAHVTVSGRGISGQALDNTNSHTSIEATEVAMSSVCPDNCPRLPAQRPNSRMTSACEMPSPRSISFRPSSAAASSSAVNGSSS